MCKGSASRGEELLHPGLGECSPGPLPQPEHSATTAPPRGAELRRAMPAGGHFQERAVGPSQPVESLPPPSLEAGF